MIKMIILDLGSVGCMSIVILSQSAQDNEWAVIINSRERAQEAPNGLWWDYVGGRTFKQRLHRCQRLTTGRNCVHIRSRVFGYSHFVPSPKFPNSELRKFYPNSYSTCYRRRGVPNVQDPRLDGAQTNVTGCSREHHLALRDPSPFSTASLRLKSLCSSYYDA